MAHIFNRFDRFTVNPPETDKSSKNVADKSSGFTGGH